MRHGAIEPRRAWPRSWEARSVSGGSDSMIHCANSCCGKATYGGKSNRRGQEGVPNDECLIRLF